MPGIKKKGNSEFKQNLSQSTCSIERAIGKDILGSNYDCDTLVPIPSRATLGHLRTTGETSEIPNRAKLGHLRTMEETSEISPGNSVDALEFLVKWVSDPKRPAYCALLGETGIGKTTTCKALTQHLLHERKNKPSTPLPIYLDLRYIVEVAKDNPNLDRILATILDQSWRSSDIAKTFTPQDIRQAVQEGALVIFDGLDEVLVHLKPAAGQLFTRQLWSILPPQNSRQKTSSPRGKLLLSCRNHYFRTFRHQSRHLLGEDREGFSDSDYSILILLPFTEKQIREYLEKNLKDVKVDSVLETVRSVHNLYELAERPYTLSLIAHHFPTRLGF